MKKLNIAIGKFGKSMLFNKDKWGMIGGDSEAPSLLSSLAQMNPDINFYIIGRSNWYKLDYETKSKINKNNNIIDIWENWDSSIKEESYWANFYFKRFNIKIDYAILMSGPAGASSMTNAMYTLDHSRVAKPSSMFRRYVGSISRYLNDFNISYCELGEDPRYIPCQARDLFNRPKEILSTRDNVKFKIKHIPEYMNTELVETEMYTKNFHVDKLFMMSEPVEKLLKSPGNRTNLLSVYSNGLTDTGGMEKYDHIKEYILDNFYDQGATIYGSWPEEFLKDEKYKNAFIEKPMIELNKQMYNTKYSFMIPIQKGWPSSKFWKHLMFGIIPFWHPFADTDLTANSPEFLRLNSAKDFKQKIEYLENNPAKYLELWKECQKLLKKEYFTGEFYNNLILNHIQEKTGIDTEYYKNNRMPITYKMSCLYPEIKKKKIKTLF